MSSIAATNETSNVTSLPTAPKPQTSKEVIAANVKLLIEQLGRPQRRAHRLPHRNG
jgi:hypothetical protein